MGIQQAEHFLQAGLDLRRRRGVRSDEPDSVDHARGNLRRERVVLLFVCRGRTHPRNASGRGNLVDVPRPAVMEHPFVAPFVAELFDQHGDESCYRVGGMDRRLGVKFFDPVDDRGGILDASSVRRNHQRDDRHFGVLLEFRMACRIAQNPLMRNALVAEIGAYFHRVGRHFGADDAISVRHGVVLQLCLLTA
jgi:hypothetical protein